VNVISETSSEGLSLGMRIVPGNSVHLARKRSWKDRNQYQWMSGLGNPLARGSYYVEAAGRTDHGLSRCPTEERQMMGYNKLLLDSRMMVGRKTPRAAS